MIACSIGHAAGAAGAVGPTWESGPDRAYNCTHYLAASTAWKHAPQIGPGEPMNLVMPRDKVMKFGLAARPATKRGKVHFELDKGPIGATLRAATFEWKVAGTAGQQLEFAVIAVGDDGGRTPWPIHVTIADDKLFTAWSAGMGSVWPDCEVFVDGRFDVGDLDGDGKDDVMFRRIVGSDGTTETSVMLQRGKLKFVEAMTCTSCWPTREVAADGSQLLVTSDDCCCILSIAVVRLDGDRYVDVQKWQVPTACTSNPDEVATLTFERNAKQQITGAEQRDARGKVERWVWRDKTFVPR